MHNYYRIIVNLIRNVMFINFFFLICDIATNIVLDNNQL